MHFKYEKKAATFVWIIKIIMDDYLVVNTELDDLLLVG